MAIRLAGMRLLDLQEAVAIRIQCSLPDVLRLDLMTQLKLMNDTGLISVASMQQLACSPAILQQYQQQMFRKPSPFLPVRRPANPFTTGSEQTTSVISSQPTDFLSELSSEFGTSTMSMESVWPSKNSSVQAVETDSVLRPFVSTILGTAATNTDPFTCYPSTSSASQSLQQTQDSPFSLDTVHATTATAADNMLHFTPSLLSQADCDLIVPSTLPITQHAATNLNTQRVHSHVQVCPQVFPALDTPTLSNTTAPSSWGFDGTEELLAELVDLDALEQLLPAAPTGADGDISHTKNFAELGRAFDRAIIASAEPMDTPAPWQWEQQSSLEIAQPQLDLGLPTCSVAQPALATKFQALHTTKPGLAALDNLVAFDMADCSNPMPLCRSQPQDFRASCTTQSCTSSQSTASTTIVQQSLPIVSTLEQPKVDVSVRHLVQPSSPNANPRPSSGAKKRSKRRPRVSSSTTCSNQQPPSPTDLPKAKVPSAIGCQSAESVGECTSPLPHKRSKTSRQLSTIADNERRRVANMSPTRLEHVRQLSREAARRRKNRQRQTMKQLQRAVVELELKQRGLVGEQASLEKERQRLYTLVRKQNTKMVSC
eukprot:m.41761 g.41761  ORF g.41761 m.41761 type:complete len:599 (+) comp12844_c0_seq25:140-1936(+)